MNTLCFIRQRFIKQYMKRGWNMYLHKNRETFRDLILQVADKKDKTPIVVEKDYYVTLILRLLSEKLEQ